MDVTDVRAGLSACASADRSTAGSRLVHTRRAGGGQCWSMDRDRVAALTFFAGIPEAEIDVVAGRGTARAFAPGEVVTSERDFGHCLYVVEEGSADVTLDGEAVASVGAGAVIGEVAVLL